MSEIIGMDIAVIVVTISIVLSGIILGLGKAFSLKRVELFGLEELTQSIINAALVGGIFVIIDLIQTLSTELIENTCSTDSLIKNVECLFLTLSDSLFLFSQNLTELVVLVGYYQSLVLDFNAFEIQPFQNLSAVSSSLSSDLLYSNILLILLNFNIQLLSFFSENAILLFLPIGLVFRSFFATRKLGGFLIALAIGMYLFYPAFISIFPIPTTSVEVATSNITQITNNSLYATAPIIDLNDNYAIATKLDNMTSTNFVNDLSTVQENNAKALSQISLYSIFAPLFSFFLTMVFIKEFGNILGSEMSFSLGVV